MCVVENIKNFFSGGDTGHSHIENNGLKYVEEHIVNMGETINPVFINEYWYFQKTDGRAKKIEYAFDLKMKPITAIFYSADEVMEAACEMNNGEIDLCAKRLLRAFKKGLINEGGEVIYEINSYAIFDSRTEKKFFKNERVFWRAISV